MRLTTLVLFIFLNGVAFGQAGDDSLKSINKDRLQSRDEVESDSSAITLSLQVGNEYFYYYRSGIDIAEVKYQIVKDSVDEENGETYFFLDCISDSDFEHGGCKYFDGKLRVVNRDSIFFQHKYPRRERQGLIYNLDDTVGSKWSITPGEAYYGMKVDEIQEINIFDETYLAKGHGLYGMYDPEEDVISGPVYEYLLISDKFGIVRWSGNEGGGSIELKGAVINGEVYGDTTFTGTSNHKYPNREYPQEIELYKNYPNPFNPSTEIRFSLPRAAEVRLKVYDLMGREVATLVDEWLPAGNRTVTFDAGNLSSGVYLYRLQADGYTETRKMLLVK